MDAERRADWIKARAEAYEVSLARHIVAPKSEPKVEILPPVKLDETEKRARELLAQYAAQTFVDGRVEHANAARDELWRDVLGGMIAELRKAWRAEINEQVGLLRADYTIDKAAAERREHDGNEVTALSLRARRA
jgi:hypothetical protein